MPRIAILTVMSTTFVMVLMGCSTSDRVTAMEVEDGQFRLTTLGPSMALTSPEFEPAPYRLAAGDTLGAAIFADYIAHLRSVMASQQQPTPPTLQEAVALAEVSPD